MVSQIIRLKDPVSSIQDLLISFYKVYHGMRPYSEETAETGLVAEKRH